MMEIRVDEPKPGRTLVLVGRTGNGKSATGSTIITTLNTMMGKPTPKRPFISKLSATGVTRSCKLETSEFEGRPITVIDTPGLFDLSVESDFIAEELVKCLTLAKNGIDAVLLVFSVRSRLTAEEKSALINIRSIFGSHIVEHIIVVFTGGDALENDDQTLQDYLTDDCPEFLKELLSLCDNRMVLFNNNTRDKSKRENQVKALLQLVEKAVEHNNGIPYTDDLHQTIQKFDADFLKEQEKIKLENQHSNRSREELLDMLNKSTAKNRERIVLAVNAHIIKTRKNMETQMAKEREEKRKVEKMAEEERKRFRDEQRKIQEEAIKQREFDRISAEERQRQMAKKIDDLQRALQNQKPAGTCSIL